ncbi:F0F1 ATP synthase subunit delta [Poseidonocella sp. HB161398]|uniref:F0F1 ATP synthase subunit delta n=1 Tax=Poseidonocella sp. HB161398 TaxID=2320855 RepID=UPI001109A773|nr:F0F1 ATP synthase subunit delta [Poseidonocella sp. HB161398]
MTFDWWTLGLQTVNVLVLFWILSHFLFRPVSEIIAKRQAAAMDELGRARADRARAEAALAEARARDDDVAQQRAALLSEAQEGAERARQHLLEEARQEAAGLRAGAEAEARRLRREAEAAMQDAAADLAVEISQRLLARLPGPGASAGFIDGLAKAVAELPEQTRQGLGAAGPVAIRAACALGPEETRALADRLAAVLGREVALSVSVDPALIAGLELDAPHAVVRNHFRADLDRIRQELGAHG